MRFLDREVDEQPAHFRLFRTRGGVEPRVEFGPSSDGAADFLFDFIGKCSVRARPDGAVAMGLMPHAGAAPAERLNPAARRTRLDRPVP
jgi:hypothetical protein